MYSVKHSDIRQYTCSVNARRDRVPAHQVLAVDHPLEHQDDRHLSGQADESEGLRLWVVEVCCEGVTQIIHQSATRFATRIDLAGKEVNDNNDDDFM